VARAAAARDEPAGPVDVNSASAGELARLPGIGPSLARRIVGERERGGAFESLEALRRVYGLGPRKLIALHGLVVAIRGGNPPAEASPAASPPSDAATTLADDRDRAAGAMDSGGDGGDTGSATPDDNVGDGDRAGPGAD
jgi:competence protein ComEA